MIGIYAIINRENWRSYVGSSVDIEKRIEVHFQELRRGIHINNQLQIDYNNNFCVEILELCKENELLSKEEIWINNGCNLYNKTNPHIDINLTEKQIKNFWSKVDIKEGNECWNWLGCKDKDGYGRTGFRINGIKKTFRSNRLAYYLTYPNNNKNLVVCHQCNNTSCCNPNHLFLGSLSSNTKDCRDKGRRNKQKLNWNHVFDIRNKFNENPDICQHKFTKWFKEKYNIELFPCYLINIAINKKWTDSYYNPPHRQSQRGIGIRDNNGMFIKQIKY